VLTDTTSNWYVKHLDHISRKKYHRYSSLLCLLWSQKIVVEILLSKYPKIRLLDKFWDLMKKFGRDTPRLLPCYSAEGKIHLMVYSNADDHTVNPAPSPRRWFLMCDVFTRVMRPQITKMLNCTQCCNHPTRNHLCIM